MRFQAHFTTLWLALAAILAASPSRADILPEIAAHSDKSFTVYQGDTVAVAVKTTSSEVEAKWFRGPTVFCRTLSCSIDTSHWEIGLHHLVFVVYNKAGSKFVRYHIRVVAAPESHRPQQVQPDMIPASDEAESANAYDLTVKSVHGRGYSYHQKKLQVLGPLPRALDWSESLRTNKFGGLDFGRVGVEAHTLAGGSAVRLMTTDLERRAIILKRGTLRSRSLGKAAPRWSVVVPDLVQIDTDADGDILVSRDDLKAFTAKAPNDDDGEEGEQPTDQDSPGDSPDGEKPPASDKKSKTSAADLSNAPVTITVLRGNARVFIRSRSGGKGDDAGSAVIIPAGLSVTLRPDENPSSLGLPPLKATAALVAETSPQYLQGHWEEGVSNALAFTASAPKTKSLEEAMAKAAALRGDPILVLEVLLPKYADAKSSYQGQLALGEAYKALYLFEAAVTALKAAAALQPNAPEPLLLLGEMALLSQQWATAERYLSSARDKDAPDSQRLNYELGVAAFYAKDGSTAASAFDRALWVDDGSPELALSARDFRQRTTPSRWYDLRAHGGLLYDSNLLHSDSLDPTTLGAGLKTKKGVGYVGAIGFSLWPWRTSGFSTEIAFDDGKTGYFTKSLGPLARIDQNLALRFRLGFGDGDGPQPLALGLELFARSLAIGGQPAMDELGQVLSISSPAFFDLRLAIAPTNAVDPLPARAIIVDPLLWEVVTPGDRSSRLLYYSVGVTPLRGDHLRCDIDLSSGKTTYKSSYEAAESYRLLGLKAHFDYASTPRSIWSAGLGGTTRTFSTSDDHRKDTLMEFNAGWRWYFLPPLSQTLELGYDKQKSSRSVNGYKRQLLTYRFDWTF